MTTPNPAANVGKITQVIGSTLDAQFAEESMPSLLQRLKVESSARCWPGRARHALVRGRQHLGGGQVRAVALGSTDGLQARPGDPRPRHAGDGAGRRGDARPRLQPGRDTIDDRGPLPKMERRVIHQSPPAMSDLSSKTEIFETGIQGDRPALSAGAAAAACSAAPASQDGHHPGADRRLARFHSGYSCFAGVGERTREGNDLWLEMQEAKIATPASRSSTRP